MYFFYKIKHIAQSSVQFQREILFSDTDPDMGINQPELAYGTVHKHQFLFETTIWHIIISQ